MGILSLKTPSLSLRFSDANGALIGMDDTKNGWVIHRRPELGLSWRLVVPVTGGQRDNNVYGEKQPLSKFEIADGEITFTWDGVVSELAGALDIRVTVRVKAEGDQAVWYTRVENRSGHIVESVFSPYIGDLTPPRDAEWFKVFGYAYMGSFEGNLWPRFDGHKGDWGILYPTQYYSPGAPSSPLCILRSQNRGLYVGVKSRDCEMVVWHAELRPGYDSTMDNTVPKADEIEGKPVHILFAPVHECYIQSGESRDLTPIALAAFEGDWHKGIDIYKANRDALSDREAVAPAWARDPHAWLQIQMNSPEDELRYRFTDLTKIAADCKKHGITAIQLVGWNDGGQDQGNPSHDFDPRLGTLDEFKTAIRDCQKIGVRIILFSKFTWSDKQTPRYKSELFKYAASDPFGDPYQHSGYEYYTPAQFLDIRKKRLVAMCFACEDYMKVCEEEFQKLLSYGCDGMLFDECQHHSPSLLCFNTAHGHCYGECVYRHDLDLIRRLKALPGVPKDFLFSGEACYDMELEEYQLAYHRSRSRNYCALARYMRPHAQMMTSVAGFDDRDSINQCLLYRYIISYEPFYFKGLPSDYPSVIRYGNQMDALRTELRRYFWDGEFRDTQGATVTKEDGSIHHPYAVYRATDGTCALVIVNYDDKPVTVCASLDRGSLGKWRTVEDSTWHAGAKSIRIPAKSAVVVTP